MKKYINHIGLFVAILALNSCVSEEDQQLPPYNPIIYSEDFQGIANSNFDISGWTNVATEGSKIWIEKAYKGNGYLEFSPFGSNENVNEAWLVTPKIDISEANAKTLVFKIAQHHVVDTTENKVQVYITNEFNGDIATTQWTEKPCELPKVGQGNNYKFVSSGKIDLSEYPNEVYIAFKATGGSANNKSGSYQIDDIKIF